IIGSGEIWLALWALDLPASVVNALILQSTVLTIRSAAFAVPAGLGVQEGGYLVVGNLLGIPGEGAFALSLVARAREIGLGVPGLITWQFIEARRLWRVRARWAATLRYYPELASHSRNRSRRCFIFQGFAKVLRPPH